MPSRHTHPLAVFLLLCGIYLLTISGHTYSADEETMLAVTRSLLARGSVAIEAPADAPLAALRPGVEGGRYSPYGILPSLLALPLHALGGLASPLGAPAADYASRFAVTALNGPLTAATAALLAAWALRLGAARGWAVALALLYGLATFAWPYTRTFFSEPLAALLIMLAAERADAAARQNDPARRTRALLVAGLACGLLLATRIAAGVAVPVIGLYVLWICWQQRGAGIAPRASSSVLRSTFPWLLGLLPGLALVVWYNLARFGTVLATGYASEGALFTTPLAEGLYGLLLSPGKSVLLYAPALLLALPGGVALWRRGERPVVLLALGLFLSHLLLYAQWGEWAGGGVWGPRFLLPVVAPLLLLGAGWGATQDQGQRTKDEAQASGRAARGVARITPDKLRVSPTSVPGPWSLVLGLGLLGFAGNLGGLLLHPGTYVVTTPADERIYTVQGSPLLAHWRLLGERWGRAGAPAPVCRLGDGLFASESVEGAVLPRRTGGMGELRCVVQGGARVQFALDDRRPPAAPPSELRLLVDGRPIGAPPPGQLRVYSLLLAPGATGLEVAARTWNPLAVGFSERDDELGPQLAALQGRTADGATVAVVDTAVAPLPARPGPRWAWYYDPPNQHLADHWAWHLPRSELAGPAAWLLGALIVVLGGGCLAAGARLMRA